jgi:hypothetical protein
VLPVQVERAAPVGPVAQVGKEVRAEAEGVANRIDPESCATDAREGIGEALTGERIGQPLSRESTLIPGADVDPVRISLIVSGDFTRW